MLIYNSKVGLDFFEEPILGLEYLDYNILYFLFINLSLKVSIVKVVFKESFNLVYSLSFKQGNYLKYLLYFRLELVSIKLDIKPKL